MEGNIPKCKKELTPNPGIMKNFNFLLYISRIFGTFYNEQILLFLFKKIVFLIIKIVLGLKSSKFVNNLDFMKSMSVPCHLAISIQFLPIKKCIINDSLKCLCMVYIHIHTCVCSIHMYTHRWLNVPNNKASTMKNNNDADLI